MKTPRWAITSLWYPDPVISLVWKAGLDEERNSVTLTVESWTKMPS
jgi:hypothetical protein